MSSDAPHARFADSSLSDWPNAKSPRSGDPRSAPLRGAMAGPTPQESPNPRSPQSGDLRSEFDGIRRQASGTASMFGDGWLWG